MGPLQFTSLQNSWAAKPSLACFLFCQLVKDFQKLHVVTSSIISCYTKGTTFINARRMYCEITS